MFIPYTTFPSQQVQHPIPPTSSVSHFSTPRTDTSTNTSDENSYDGRSIHDSHTHAHLTSSAAHQFPKPGETRLDFGFTTYNSLESYQHQHVTMQNAVHQLNPNHEYIQNITDCLFWDKTPTAHIFQRKLSACDTWIHLLLKTRDGRQNKNTDRIFWPHIYTHPISARGTKPTVHKHMIEDSKS